MLALSPQLVTELEKRHGGSPVGLRDARGLLRQLQDLSAVIPHGRDYLGGERMVV